MHFKEKLLSAIGGAAIAQLINKISMIPGYPPRDSEDETFMKTAFPKKNDKCIDFHFIN